MPAQTKTSIVISARAPPTFQGEFVALIPHLRAFSRMLCGRRGVADDMTQEALAKAWRSRDSFQSGTNMKAWLFTILRNEFYSFTRRAWRETLWDEEKGERIAAPANAQQWASELGDAARAMGKLPHDQREALILVGAGGFTYEEAAAICRTRAGTMKSRVARARVALQNALDGDVSLPVRAVGALKGACDDILAQLNTFTHPHSHGAAAHA
jgi:RNA polymerase sigma-70 factor (ECF subfamily)